MEAGILQEICSSDYKIWPSFNTFQTNKCTKVNKRRRKETNWERKKAIALHDTCQLKKTLLYKLKGLQIASIKQ